ncbi:MAG: hypothetical protein AAF696_30705, partial [Bacteroidota bacterium]
MSEIRKESLAHFKDANKLYVSKLYEDALQQYKRATELHASFTDAHFCVAKTLLRLKKTEEGLAYFEKYQELIPKEKRPNYVVGLAGILSDEGEDEQAYKLSLPHLSGVGDKQLISFLKILLNANHLGEARAKLSSLSPEQAKLVLAELDQASGIREDKLAKLKELDILKNFHLPASILKKLSGYDALQSEYQIMLDTQGSIVSGIQTKADIDFLAETDKLKSGNTQLQKLMFQDLEQQLESKNLGKVSQAISILSGSGYDKQSLQKIKQKLSAEQQAKNQDMSQLNFSCKKKGLRNFSKLKIK